MGTPTQPNAYCIVHGTTLPEGAFIEGPFETQEEADSNAAEDLQHVPNVSVQVTTLVNPANC